MCSTLCASATLRRSCCCCPANTQQATAYISFQHEKHPPMKLGLGKRTTGLNEAVDKTAPRTPHVQPSPYLCRRCPRGAVFRTWEAALPCRGAPLPAKQEEHIESPELPLTLGCCFTALKTKIIFHLKKTWQAAVQGLSPAVSIIRGKLMRCQVLQSSRKDKGFVLYYALTCIFPSKCAC